MKAVTTLLLPVAFTAFTAYTQPPDNLLAALKTDRQKADTLMHFALKHFYDTSLDSTAYFLNKGLPYAEKTTDNGFIAYYLLTLGNAYTLNEEPQNGLLALRKAKGFLDKVTEYPLHMKYFVFTALAFERLHQNDSALHYMHLAEALNNRTDPYRNWVVYTQIGNLFHRSEDYPQAEKYFSKAYEITKAKGIRVDYGLVLYHFSNMVYDWGRTDKFAYLLEEKERFAQTSKISNAIDPAHRVMFVDWSKKSFTEGVRFLEEVKTDFQKRERWPNVATINQYLAEFYEREKAYDKALACLRENTALMAKETDVLRLYYQSHMMYRILKEAGRSADAVAEADKLFALRDSITRRQKAETVMELETKYQTEKKEKDLVLLNAENNLNAVRLAKETDLKTALQRENVLKDSVVKQEKEYNGLLGRENGLRTAQLKKEQALKAALTTENALRSRQLEKEKRLRIQLMMTAALLLLSGAAIFVLYRRQRTKNRLIQKQSEELQTLMKEIHHRVKNNLQIISSLLDLQSISINDKEASEAVKEGKNRVLSMALIHQNLYTEGNIKGIKVKDYIQNLAGSLFDSYNIQKEKIKLVTDIEPLNLDVDTVIPIGLIINELLSNSLKYAFAGREEGEIRVSLRQHLKELQLQIRDNGIGFSSGWMNNSASFGYKLIKAFSQKLKAKLEVYNDGGACVTMNIQKYKLAG